MLTATGTSVGTAPTGWAIGKTRIFLKSDQFAVLKAAQVKIRHASATSIQAAGRCRAKWTAFNRLRMAILRLQARARGASARGEVWRRRRHRAAIPIQVGLRTFLERDILRRMCVAAVVLQSLVRQLLIRSLFLSHRARVVKLQQWWRSTVKRRRWRNLQQNVLHIQRVWRGAIGRHRGKDQLARTRCLQRAVQKLVRIRKRNHAHQAWRRECLSAYRHRTKFTNDMDHDALASSLIDLWNETEAQRLEITRLWEGCLDLAQRKCALEQRGWIRFITGMRSFFRGWRGRAIEN